MVVLRTRHAEQQTRAAEQRASAAEASAAAQLRQAQLRQAQLSRQLSRGRQAQLSARFCMGGGTREERAAASCWSGVWPAALCAQRIVEGDDDAVGLAKLNVERIEGEVEGQVATLMLRRQQGEARGGRAA